MKHFKTFFAFMLMSVLSIGQVWATDVTFTPGTDTGATSVTKSGVTCTMTTMNNSSYYQIYANQSGTFSVSTGNITKIEFTCTASGTSKYGPGNVSANVGSYSYSGNKGTWTGEASSVTLSSTAQVRMSALTITISSGGSDPVAVTGVTLDQSEAEVAVGKTITLTPTVAPSNATTKTVTWESDDEDVATVDDGVVTGVAEGTTTITVKTTDGNKTATCEVTVTAAPAAVNYELVTNVANLAEGDKIIIVNADATKAISTTQNTNNRGATDVTATNNVITPGDAVQVLTLGFTNEHWTLYTGDGYLYASSSSGNQMKTQATNNANGEWTISISNGVATLTAQGTYSRNVMQYNGSSVIFACYASASQTSLKIFKKVDGSVKPAAGLAYAEADLEKLAKLGDAFTAPTLQNPNSLAVSYASNNTDVAEVAANGAITIKAAGVAVITASFDGNDDYKAGSASYTVYVAEQAGTAADPLTEASAKALIDLGCGMTAHVGGTITGSPTYNETYHNYSVTLTDGFQFYRLKDLNNADFTSGYLKAGDEVVAVGPLAKHSSTYELAEGCYLTSYTEYKEPSVTLKQSGSKVSELELAATNVSAQTIDLTYTNFENTISSVTPKLYSESTCETEITSGAWVTDITVNEAKTQLTFNVADNDSEARQVWLKVTASDGTDAAYAVLAISQAKFIVDYATLPFAFNGGRADIEDKNGMSQEGLDTDYTGDANANTKLKFNTTGDVVIIKINADPGTLTYDIKGNSYSNSTFKVQQSANGVAYTDVATYSTLGSDVNSESKTLAQTTRYVKFIYTNKSSGNVALGNIAIAAYVAPTACEAPTFNPADGESFTESLDVVLTSATEGATIYYTIDESDPTTSSSVFNTKITLTETTTIKAIAVKEGLNNSSVASATYTKAVTITSYNIDFETNNLAAYVNWEFNNIAIVSTAITAHGGTYYGNTGGKESASIKTKAKIAAPGTLTFWTSKESNNTSASNWMVEVSEDGSAWTQVGDPFSATTGDKGDWTKREADLSEHTNVYVRISYGSSTAIRAIDDISLEMAAVKPKITTQPVGAEYTKDDDAEALTIVAEAANSGALSYQWYSNSSESTEGAEAIEGADDNEYTPSTTSLGTVYYYCVVTEVGAEETTTSSIVAVVVSAAPEPTGTFELFSGELAEGEYVICSGTNAMKNTATTAPRIEAATITISENKIVNPDESVIWKVEALDGDDSGYWTFYNEAEEVYAAFTSTNARGNVIASVTNYAKWTTSDNGSIFDFTNKGLTGKYLRFNDGYGFASYATSTGEKLTLYKKQVAGQPKTPTFTVDGGTFTVAQNVEIECATEDVTIYYTLDGSTPTNESKVYSTALEISSTTTVKAIAIKNAIASDVASATYKIVSIDHAGTEADPYTIADARNAIEVGGDLSDKYVSGIISQVDVYNSTYKSITYWISDDGETTSSQLQVYSGKGLNGADFSSINDLQTGDIVVVKGTLKLYESTYEFDKDNQLVSYAKPNVPTVALKKSGSIVTVLNVEAKDVASQAIDIECTHFSNAISSVSAKLYGESTCETEISSGAWVTDITINGEKDQVTFNVADNEGARRHVWMKVSASDGTNEASATLKISQAKAAYATYPFAFDGGIEDVTNAGGMTQYGLGSDYNSSPKLKFDDTGDWLIIKTNEAPSQLTYDIKNNSFSGGTFTVQESADGENYTEVASYTDITGTQNEAVDLDQATRYIKFIYTEKVTGNVGLGNINITKYVAPEPPTPEEIWTEGVREELIEGRYYTMCLDKAVTKVRGASIWKVLSKATDGGIILEEVVGTLDAGRPYFFYATAESMDVVYTGAVVEDPVNDADNNGLVGSFERTEITKNQSNYILHNNALYFVNSEAYVGAYRAYLNMSAVPNYVPAQGNSPRRRVTMSVHAQDVATDADAIYNSEQPMKVMIDNNLYIIRAGQMYDMTGNKVK